jgi:hypothetical protein
MGWRRQVRFVDATGPLLTGESKVQISTRERESLAIAERLLNPGLQATDSPVLYDELCPVSRTKFFDEHSSAPVQNFEVVAADARCRGFAKCLSHVVATEVTATAYD